MQANEQDSKAKCSVPAIDYQPCPLTSIWKLNDNGAISSPVEGAFTLLPSAFYDLILILAMVYSPTSQSAPTSSEQLGIDAEMDGTAKGELKAEEKRQKDENWARYTDENPRGAGNTMNRG